MCNNRGPGWTGHACSRAKLTYCMCGRAILDGLERRLRHHSTAPSRAHITRKDLRTSHSPSPATSWHAPLVKTCQQQRLESLCRNDREPPEIGILDKVPLPPFIISRIPLHHRDGHASSKKRKFSNAAEQAATCELPPQN